MQEWAIRRAEAYSGQRCWNTLPPSSLSLALEREWVILTRHRPTAYKEREMSVHRQLLRGAIHIII